MEGTLGRDDDLWEESSVLADLELAARPYRGVVVDAESAGTDARVAIRFGSTQAPLAPIGRTLNALLFGGALGSGYRLSGQLVGRVEEPHSTRLELVFPRAANRWLSPLVNRRGALRVRPSGTEPVRVRLRPRGREREFLLHALDLSATGCSVRVAQDSERTLAAVYEVDVLLELPGDVDALALPGRILRRHLIDGFVRYGIGFEEAGTAWMRERVLRWVLKRHREELRSAAAATELQDPDA